jgi:hypothetical protein
MWTCSRMALQCRAMMSWISLLSYDISLGFDVLSCAKGALRQRFFDIDYYK